MASEQQSTKHLVRVMNTDLQGEKPLYVALTKIRGVDFMLSNAVCHVCNFDRTEKTGNLTDSQVEALNSTIRDPQSQGIPQWLLNRRFDPETGEDRHILGGDIKFIQGNDIKAKQKTKSYHGLRHQKGLPVRGQKTKNNFRRTKNKGGGSLGVKRKK